MYKCNMIVFAFALFDCISHICTNFFLFSQTESFAIDHVFKPGIATHLTWLCIKVSKRTSYSLEGAFDSS